jgi:hypothetical protein
MASQMPSRAVVRKAYTKPTTRSGTSKKAAAVYAAQHSTEDGAAEGTTAAPARATRRQAQRDESEVAGGNASRADQDHATRETGTLAVDTRRE